MMYLLLTLDILYIIILLLSGFISGFIDSIAGGGGLISLPVLLTLGLPPNLALGTNKLQSTFGSFASSYRYSKSKLIDFKIALPGILFTFIGASCGTLLVQSIDSKFLSYIIPFLLLAIFLYSLFNPNFGHISKAQKISYKLGFFILGLSLGFYDGFFGPGTGNFWVILLIASLGFNFLAATAYTKIMNFTSNLAALIFFTLGNNVVFKLGIIMGLGQIIGARIGASLAIKKGTGFIRKVFLTIVLILILTLFYKQYFIAILKML